MPNHLSCRFDELTAEGIGIERHRDDRHRDMPKRLKYALVVNWASVA